MDSRRFLRGATGASLRLFGEVAGMKPLAWLASFRLRILFRTSFLLLALAVVAMAVAVLQEEKQRSYDNYQASFAKTKEQIVARLRHPAGQLALLNPPRGEGPVTPLRPVMLPFSAIDFDDQGKVRHAVEMAGCLVQYKNYGSLCVAIANNPWAGGFIYAAGTFVSSTLLPHRIGNEFLDGAHRLRVVVSLRGETYRWVAPFEVPSRDERRRASGMRGRFTGYVELDDRDYTGEMPVKEFRGWVWQSGRCLDATKESDEDCEKKSFFSLRLPIDALRDALFQPEKPQWPPPDLDQFQVQVEVLPPGDGPALFDSNADGAVPPFSLNDLTALLLPGETLMIQKADRGEPTHLVQLQGKDEVLEEPSALLTRLIRKLPVERYDAPVELADEVVTPMGSYRILFHGDARSVNKILSAVASRVSWFVGAMLLAIALAWLVIETGVVRRISRLTRRSSALSRSVKAIGGLQRFDLADLRGSDELGILANCLNDLLRRVKEDAERERIRAEQERTCGTPLVTKSCRRYNRSWCCMATPTTPATATSIACSRRCVCSTATPVRAKPFSPRPCRCRRSTSPSSCEMSLTTPVLSTCVAPRRTNRCGYAPTSSPSKTSSRTSSRTPIATVSPARRSRSPWRARRPRRR
jgi:hypothetical protein